MSNNDWIILPIFIWDYLPKSIIDDAKSLSESTKMDDVYNLAVSIAKKKDINPGIVIDRAFPYDKLQTLDYMQTDIDNPNRTDFYFLDDDIILTIDLKLNECVDIIHKFLSKKPKYRILDLSTNHIIHSQPPMQNE